MEGETTVCTNCQRPISSVNYVMHSLHCHRNLEKCPICDEAVPRSDMSTHAEQHAEESCSECGEKVARDLHEIHKANKCKFRKVSCLFCNLEMPLVELQEHEDYCGSRTERCNECGKFVMLKYQQLHLDSNHGFLKLDDDPMSPLDRLLALRLREDDVEILSERNSGLAGCSSPSASVPNDIAPCEFCSAMVPVQKLFEHQTGCRPDLTSFAPAETSSKVKKTSVNSAVWNFWPDPTAPTSNDNTSNATTNSTASKSNAEWGVADHGGLEVELPCEFCDVAYPAFLLNEHQEVCEARISVPDAAAEHHWSMPTPSARVVTPPLTRKRLNNEAKSKSQPNQQDEVKEEKESTRAPNSNVNRRRHPSSSKTHDRRFSERND